MTTSHYYQYYAAQASQTGNGQFFIGQQYQRGAGLGDFFRGIFNFVRPLFKPAAKFVGKTILKTGSNILSDVSSGRNLKESAREHLKEAGSQIADTAMEKIKTMRGGKPLKRKRIAKKAQSQPKRQQRRSIDTLD